MRVADRMLSPPQVAQRFGVAPEKILAWIHSGELRAIDVATRRGGRPRYRVDPADLALFVRKRTVGTPTPATRRIRKPPTNVIEFF